MKEYDVTHHFGERTKFHYFILSFSDIGRRVDVATAITLWCKKNFGERPAGRWDAVVTHPTSVTFLLKDETAAASFRLFWT